VRAHAGLVFAVLMGVSATAETARAEPAYILNPKVEVPAAAIAGTLGAAWLLRSELSAPACAPLCDRNRLWAFDRGAAGRWSPAASTASDVAAALAVGGSLLVPFLLEGFKDGANASWIILESVLGALGSSSVASLASRRPRPYVYGELAPLDKRMSGDAGLSFFSGHTASTTAAVVSLYSTLRRLYPGSVWPSWALAFGSGLVATVGVGRILGGHHFPSDVLAGAAAGASMGVLVPALHGVPIRVIPVASEHGPVLSAMGTF
jgi:membrane-associated phospholipid phosphatase